MEIEVPTANFWPIPSHTIYVDEPQAKLRIIGLKNRFFGGAWRGFTFFGFSNANFNSSGFVSK